MAAIGNILWSPHNNFNFNFNNLTLSILDRQNWTLCYYTVLCLTPDDFTLSHDRRFYSLRKRWEKVSYTDLYITGLVIWLQKWSHRKRWTWGTNMAASGFKMLTAVHEAWPIQLYRDQWLITLSEIWTFGNRNIS